MTDNIDHAATRKALTEQAEQFIANPAGWPAAMAARALRLRQGHRPYSPGNQALILFQLFLRSDNVADAIRAAADEIAPAHVWKKRGYTPQGPSLTIWSRPVAITLDPVTRRRCPKDTPDAITRTMFLTEQTYHAADVVNADGDTGMVAFAAPELPEGEAREVFERLAAWITGQGWTVRRSGRDMEEGGYTVHAHREIVVHGGLAGWAAVETLAHEIAHALLHGSDDDRPYAGEHRGDMEAEAEAVAFGLLTAFGQCDLARGSARYAVEWTRDPKRVAIAYEQASHVLDAVAAVAFGESDVEVKQSAKAERAQTKADNKALAAALRAAGLEPKGEAWDRAKAGESIEAIAADMLGTGPRHLSAVA